MLIKLWHSHVVCGVPYPFVPVCTDTNRLTTDFHFGALFWARLWWLLSENDVSSAESPKISSLLQEWLKSSQKGLLNRGSTSLTQRIVSQVVSTFRMVMYSQFSVHNTKQSAMSEKKPIIDLCWTLPPKDGQLRAATWYNYVIPHAHYILVELLVATYGRSHFLVCNWEYMVRSIQYRFASRLWIFARNRGQNLTFLHRHSGNVFFRNTLLWDQKSGMQTERSTQKWKLNYIEASQVCRTLKRIKTGQTACQSHACAHPSCHGPP